MNINYKIKGIEKNVEENIPSTLYLRHDYSSGELLFAALSSDEFLDDPKDQYHYSEFITKNNPEASYYLYKQYINRDEDIEEETFTTFDEFVSNKDVYVRYISEGEIETTIVDYYEEELNKVADTGPSLDDISALISQSQDFSDDTKAALVSALTALKLDTTNTAT